eukprot:4841026-Pyramimonas_sp.AAC.1
MVSKAFGSRKLNGERAWRRSRLRAIAKAIHWPGPTMKNQGGRGARPNPISCAPPSLMFWQAV